MMNMWPVTYGIVGSYFYSAACRAGPNSMLILCKGCLQKKKNYVDRETVPIPSYPPTIEAVSEYLDREYW